MDLPITITLLDIRSIVPEVTLICAGLIIMLLDLILKKKELVALVGVTGTVLALYGTYKLYGIADPQFVFAYMFVIDGYSHFF